MVFRFVRELSIAAIEITDYTVTNGTKIEKGGKKEIKEDDGKNNEIHGESKQQADERERETGGKKTRK